MRKFFALITLAVTLCFSSVASADENDNKEDKNWRLSLGGFMTANTNLGGGGFLSLEGDLWENEIVTFGIGGEVIFDTFNLPVNVSGLDYMRGYALDFIFAAKIRVQPVKFMEFGFGLGLGARYFHMGKSDPFTSNGVLMEILGTNQGYLILPMTLHIGFRPSENFMIAVVYKPVCGFGQVYQVGMPKYGNRWLHRVGLQLEFLL